MRAKRAIYSPTESGRTARRAWILREAKGASLGMSDEKVGDDESRPKKFGYQ
jgi:DNA-binding PadR family transcriptional regulator